ncbi:MAG: glycoside hydrolase family 5 protein [Oscillospiraceae bacterium]|nr:glycoside hydrolase family 5 protein [Oscillospiraceae bacterium]
MKKSIVLSALILSFILSGCSNSAKSSDITVQTETAQTSSETSSTSSQESASTALSIPEISLQKKTLPENEAIAFVQDMKAGWNLGNTFDAISDGGYNEATEMKIESSWCGIATTKEMIDEIKKAGFNTVRIPVSWHNHLIDGNFTISQKWLDRIKEVVDYAISNDMYAIINIHHDINKAYYYPSSEYLENSKKYISAIWTQLCQKFGDYDNHLIFESINEPRLAGTNYEWWFDKNSAQCIDAANCINELNQLFVDTVRASGGNNASRYLMCPGYSASASSALMDEFKLPKDSVQNRLIVSVHAYTPYSFALQDMNQSGSKSDFKASNSSDTGEITSFMDSLYQKFISNGIPVVIGEFGARDKNSNTQARIDFTAYYVAYARANGITCCWWDNNAFSGSGENFGIFERKTLAWKYPEIKDAIIKYCQ